MRFEVLGPPHEAIPTGDGPGLATVGLRVGVAYRLRVSNLPNVRGRVFPDHRGRRPPAPAPRHRPGRFPIRVVLGADDLQDVVDRGRLVTQVVYLEDPEQALPLSFPKDEIPIVTLGRPRSRCGSARRWAASWRSCGSGGGPRRPRNRWGGRRWT
jgi:hypothetical protein